MALVSGQGQGQAVRQENDQKKEENKQKNAEKRKARYENALKLKDELSKVGLLDKLSPAVKEFVLDLCKDPDSRSSSASNGVLQQLFGPTPKVGQSITFEDAVKKTYKGMSTLEHIFKRYEKKGIVITCKINQQNMLATTYTITALPQ
jgi:hypothetical protein